jgi:formate dehydrogenase subunit delta
MHFHYDGGTISSGTGAIFVRIGVPLSACGLEHKALGKEHGVVPWEAARAKEIAEDLKTMDGPLLPIVVERFAPINDQAIRRIAVVSFDHDFRRKPAGRHLVQVCRAEAWQSMGCEKLASRLERGCRDNENLVPMANRIAAFLRLRPHQQAVAGTEDHICKFWAPRMRAKMAEPIAQGGEGLTPLACEAAEPACQPKSGLAGH